MTYVKNIAVLILKRSSPLKIFINSVKILFFLNLKQKSIIVNFLNRFFHKIFFDFFLNLQFEKGQTNKQQNELQNENEKNSDQIKAIFKVNLSGEIFVNI